MIWVHSNANKFCLVEVQLMPLPTMEEANFASINKFISLFLIDGYVYQAFILSFELIFSLLFLH